MVQGFGGSGFRWFRVSVVQGFVGLGFCCCWFRVLLLLV